MVLLDIFKVCLLILTVITFTFSAKEYKSKSNNNMYPVPVNTGHFPSNYDKEKVDKDIKSWRRGDNNNIEEFSGLYDGDIMLSTNQRENFGIRTLWYKSNVPYIYGLNQFTTKQKNIIDSAMDRIMRNSDIIFRSYTKKDKNYIVFQSSDNGCWSYVGQQEKGQVINIQKPYCMDIGTIIHLLLHTLGFYHEHNSILRNDWINVELDNVQKMKSNFLNTMHSNLNCSLRYDYDSIMHGGAYLHSRNGQKTIKPIIKVKIGQREQLSPLDIDKLSKCYNSASNDNRETDKHTNSIEEVTSIITTKVMFKNKTRTLNMLCLLWPLTVSEKCTV